MEVTSEESLNLFRCKTKDCLFASNSITTILNHEAKCRSSSIYECKQLVYKKPEHSGRQELEEEGIIPVNFHNMHFCVYDIVKTWFK